MLASFAFMLVASPPASIALVPHVIGGELTPGTVDDSIGRALKFVSGFEVQYLNVESQHALARCRGRLDCIGHWLEMHYVDYALVVLIDLGLNLARLQLVTARGAVEASRELTIERPQPSIEALTDATFALMESRGHIIGGWVWIRTVPGDARVTLQGARAETASGHRQLLPPGEYEVRAERAGFEPANARVQIERASEASLSLSLLAEPPIWTNPWLWVAVGGTAILAGSTVLWLTRTQEPCISSSSDIPCR